MSTPGAVVIGDPYRSLHRQLWSRCYRRHGNRDGDRHETTINTQHILETVTITGNLVVDALRLPERGEGQPDSERSDPNVFTPCRVEHRRLPRPDQCFLSCTTSISHPGGAGATPSSMAGAEHEPVTTSDFELDATAGIAHGTIRFRLSTGYDSGTLPAFVVVLQFGHHFRVPK